MMEIFLGSNSNSSWKWREGEEVRKIFLWKRMSMLSYSEESGAMRKGEGEMESAGAKSQSSAIEWHIWEATHTFLILELQHMRQDIVDDET